MNNRSTITRSTLSLAIVAALTAGCHSSGGGGDEEQSAPTPQKVVVATVAPDYSSGAHAVFNTESPYDGQTDLAPTSSDITVVCHGDEFFRIERFTGENVTRFDINQPDAPLAQLSTKDASGVETANSNPHDLVFASDNKAYLLRYGSPKAWIVDPKASTDDAFKTGELDLSAYSVDGAPEMERGLIVDGKLYILLQRFDQSFAPQDAYVAVFDTATDSEIDTRPDQDGLKGILLPIKNPSDIEYNAETGLIYVQGSGRFGFAPQEPEYTGGIATIDPANQYATQLLVDDGDAQNHPLGQITDMEIVSADKGYLVGYAGFNDNTLYSFNPMTGAVDSDDHGVPQPVAGIEHTPIGGLAHDAQGQLWVGIADSTDPGLELLNGEDGSVIEQRLSTTLNPSTIAICDAQ
ncbi:MAG TPA: hypothetical protein ENK26_01930 [Gammaproteobacteria bacterium]|nr:hypothetical protein [Gammaproteobacteria bacterium]